MLRDQGGITAPQADVVSLQREIARRGERSVAAPQNRDLHERSLVVESSCFNKKCCTLPSAVRGKSSTKTISRGTLNRASWVWTCALSASTSTSALPRRMT